MLERATRIAVLHLALAVAAKSFCGVRSMTKTILSGVPLATISVEMGDEMSDLYQITAIISDAIRNCRSQVAGGKDVVDIGAEELNCIAKAIICALSDSGLSIVSAESRAVIQGDKSAA